jgi:hypothetical protein
MPRPAHHRHARSLAPIAAALAIPLLARAPAASPWYHAADSVRVLAPSVEGAPGAPGTARGASPADAGRGPPGPASLPGTTGFVNTPWAGAMPFRTLGAGYDFAPRSWSHGERGMGDDHAYHATIGLLPRVEAALRLTRIVAARGPSQAIPDARFARADRMASVRVELLPARPGRPGLATGIDDLQGSRRFHSSYVVGGMPFSLPGIPGRVAAGYGSRTFSASRRVLDGAFGALEVTPWPWAGAQLEYDTEKWNVALALAPGAGFHLRFVLLHLDSPGFAAGWSCRL